MPPTPCSPEISASIRVPWIIGISVLLMLPVGCGGRTDRDASAPAIVREVSNGPVTLRLGVSDEQIERTQELRVHVEVVAEAGAQVAAEPYGLKLTEGERIYDYRVVRHSAHTDDPGEDHPRRWSFTYDLEFVLPGEYELPPAALTYTLAPSSGIEPPAPVRLETQPITVRVRDPKIASLSEEDLRQLVTLPPVELSRPWRGWVLAGVAGVAAGAALLAWFLLRGRRLSEKAGPSVPAHEWAYAQIAQLIADDPASKGLLQEYFYRISDIVRGYVERRFGLAAPEMTTEEFLTVAAADPRLAGEPTSELSEFLSTCDRVKYARHEPSRTECDQVLAAARRFIERTRERLVLLDESSERGSTRSEQAA